MKTNSLITCRMTLATAVAGVVLLLAGCGQEPPEPSATDSRPPPATARRIAGAKRPVATRPVRAAETGRSTSGEMLPDVLMRLLVDEAVNANDYQKLSVLLSKLDRIGDPAIRLRLLEGLAWFDETAVADALPFLLDDDSRVAAQAAEIVTSRISSVPRQPQREKLNVAALKLMPEDSPDRDILLATLESDSKSTCLHVLRDLESIQRTHPELWVKLRKVYRTQFGRPYVDYIDALLHYNPRED